MKRKPRIIVALLLLAGLSFLTFLPRRGSAEARQFCSMPFKQRRAAFLTYPLEKQYRLYMSVDDEPSCDMDSESLSAYLSWYMAEGDNGRAASYLLDRLNDERDEDAQLQIMHALRAVGSYGGLRGRRDIAEAVGRKVASMRGSLTERLLSEDPTRPARELSSEIEDYAR
jgi:hypothetical protein